MSLMYLYNDELYHHGIKGMKWGVRRYRNEDGSLTPAGRRRYGISERAKVVGKHALRTAVNVGRTALTDRGLSYVGRAANAGLSAAGHPLLGAFAEGAARGYRINNIGAALNRQEKLFAKSGREMSEIRKREGTAKEKDYARTYDYRQDDDYNSLSSKEKRKLGRQYDTLTKAFGTNTANGIMYKIRKNGASYKEEKAKEERKRARIALGLTAAGYLAAPAGLYGYVKYQNAKGGVRVNNAIVDEYARANGLKEVKGGFTPGFKTAKRGNQVAKATMDYLKKHGYGRSPRGGWYGY